MEKQLHSLAPRATSRFLQIFLNSIFQFRHEDLSHLGRDPIPLLSPRRRRRRLFFLRRTPRIIVWRGRSSGRHHHILQPAPERPQPTRQRIIPRQRLHVHPDGRTDHAALVVLDLGGAHVLDGQAGQVRGASQVEEGVDGVGRQDLGGQG